MNELAGAHLCEDEDSVIEIQPGSASARVPLNQKTTLRTTIVGSPSSRSSPLCFVHGWPDDSRLWLPILPTFYDRRCILVDLPRFDGEPWEETHLTLASLSSLLAATIQHEQQPVILIAHDWGAVISSLVLAEHPDLIQRIVLLDVGLPPERLECTFRLLIQIALFAYSCINAAIYLLGRVRCCTRVADWLNKNWISQLLALDSSNETIDMRSRHSASAINYLYAQRLRVHCSKRFRQANAALKEPQVPLLFLYGSTLFHDKAWRLQLMSDDWPSCDAHFINPGGHWFFHHELGAELTSEAIRKWLSPGCDAAQQAQGSSDTQLKNGSDDSDGEVRSELQSRVGHLDRHRLTKLGSERKEVGALDQSTLAPLEPRASIYYV